MSELWPKVESEQELDALSDRTESLRRGVAIIAERHGWSAASAEHVTAGSLPIFVLDGGQILKLYPGLYRQESGIEARALAHLDGKLPAPRPLATGELEGWSYLAMTRLPGRPLSEVWPELPMTERIALAEALGEWLRTLHALPVSGLELTPGPWRRFLAGQFDGAVAEQRKLGLGAPWLERIQPFLAEADVARDGPVVMLHTEVMHEHTFVERANGKWRISGLLDFEPSLLGAREYEFASVGIFWSCGDAEVLRRLLLTYGYQERELDHRLQRRLLAYALLHRYTHLGWYLRRMPPRPGVDTLGRLAAQWWALPGVVAD